MGPFVCAWAQAIFRGFLEEHWDFGDRATRVSEFARDDPHGTNLQKRCANALIWRQCTAVAAVLLHQAWRMEHILVLCLGFMCICMGVDNLLQEIPP